MLAVSERVVEEVLVVSLKGRIDSSNSEELTGILRGYNSRLTRGLVLNVQELNYVTSAGFRSLMIAKNETQAMSRSFILAGVQSSFKELLDVTGLTSLFEIYETEHLALTSMN
jgi:anti-anti-sigma factor